MEKAQTNKKQNEVKRIVVVSDCTDVAFNEIRAMLIKELGDLSDTVVIEPLVAAKEFSIINGAFLVRLMAELYDPKSALFLVILNPLVTTGRERARIIGETQNGFRFVGANTGVLNWLISDFGLKKIYTLRAPGLTGKDFISFGGKHIHAPAAAKIAKGSSLSDLGDEQEKTFLSDFNIPDGTVVHIDNFGVVKIKGQLGEFKEGETKDIFVNGRKAFSAVFTHSMKDHPDGTITIYPGSSLNKLPELGKVRELETAKKLNLAVGDVIKW